jgi:hypothetical protein
MHDLYDALTVPKQQYAALTMFNVDDSARRNWYGFNIVLIDSFDRQARP